MQITSQFTIAVHTLTLIDLLGAYTKVTSKIIASSVGANPVIIRNILGKLKAYGLIETSQGKTGITLKKSLNEITFYDIYKAVESVDETGLFRVHEKPNMICLVGNNIHQAMEDELRLVQDSMEEQMKAITVHQVAKKIPVTDVEVEDIERLKKLLLETPNRSG